MTAANYSLLVGLIFAVGAIAQVFRAVMGVPITIGQTSIPVWVSWIACCRCYSSLAWDFSVSRVVQQGDG
jgi:hypothetical protein